MRAMILARSFAQRVAALETGTTSQDVVELLPVPAERPLLPKPSRSLMPSVPSNWSIALLLAGLQPALASELFIHRSTALFCRRFR